MRTFIALLSGMLLLVGTAIFLVDIKDEYWDNVTKRIESGYEVIVKGEVVDGESLDLTQYRIEIDDANRQLHLSNPVKLRIPEEIEEMFDGFVDLVRIWICEPLGIVHNIPINANITWS